MKTLIQSILISVGIFVGMIALAFGICTLEAKMDASVWNDGICQCGGEFEFSNATHRKNGGNFYYYACNDCGKVIETNHQQSKSHKTYEIAAIVDEVNPETGYITLIDCDGEAWVYEGEGFEAGQMVIIEFDDLETNDIYDDEIIKIRG